MHYHNDKLIVCLHILFTMAFYQGNYFIFTGGNNIVLLLSSEYLITFTHLLRHCVLFHCHWECFSPPIVGCFLFSYALPIFNFIKIFMKMLLHLFIYPSIKSLFPMKMISTLFNIYISEGVRFFHKLMYVFFLKCHHIPFS